MKKFDFDGFKNELIAYMEKAYGTDLSTQLDEKIESVREKYLGTSETDTNEPENENFAEYSSADYDKDPQLRERLHKQALAMVKDGKAKDYKQAILILTSK